MTPTSLRSICARICSFSWSSRLFSRRQSSWADSSACNFAAFCSSRGELFSACSRSFSAWSSRICSWHSASVRPPVCRFADLVLAKGGVALVEVCAKAVQSLFSTPPVEPFALDFRLCEGFGCFVDVAVLVFEQAAVKIEPPLPIVQSALALLQFFLRLFEGRLPGLGRFSGFLLHVCQANLGLVLELGEFRLEPGPLRVGQPREPALLVGDLLTEGRQLAQQVASLRFITFQRTLAPCGEPLVCVPLPRGDRLVPLAQLLAEFVEEGAFLPEVRAAAVDLRALRG